MSNDMIPNSVIPFLRRKDYVFKEELGQGSCGRTILLYDDVINNYFVCKKYSPYIEEYRNEFYPNFVREIRLLHDIYHPNVVRIFNYYLYPKEVTGYILMEYVDGINIEDYIAKNPEIANEIFRQTIEGFAYLEAKNILHRDIRPQNILVRSDGVVKIIDLGFGKHIQHNNDFDKSISLNLWCEPPSEFNEQTYNFTTEVYFVGKLFGKIIQEYKLGQFKYLAILSRMSQKDFKERFSSFAEIKTHIATEQSDEVSFEDDEIDTYRNFAVEVSGHFAAIGSDSKYQTDLERIQIRLKDIYRKCMLEETIPDCAPILQCLVMGMFRYRKKGFSTIVLKEFVEFLCKADIEKQRIALANLHTRLDSLERIEQTPFDDDIPF